MAIKRSDVSFLLSYTCRRSENEATASNRSRIERERERGRDVMNLGMIVTLKGILILAAPPSGKNVARYLKSKSFIKNFRPSGTGALNPTNPRKWENGGKRDENSVKFCRHPRQSSRVSMRVAFFASKRRKVEGTREGTS